MSRYAEGTSVPVERSRAEIEKQLSRFGASRFAYAWQEEFAMIAFEFKQRQIRMQLPLPRADEDVIALQPSGRVRAKGDIARALEAEQRRRWRSLALIVKAKLEAVVSGVTTFENEWLAYVVLPNGQTVGDNIVPQIEAAARTGQMPQLQLTAG